MEGVPSGSQTTRPRTMDHGTRGRKPETWPKGGVGGRSRSRTGSSGVTAATRLEMPGSRTRPGGESGMAVPQGPRFPKSTRRGARLRPGRASPSRKIPVDDTACPAAVCVGTEAVARGQSCPRPLSPLKPFSPETLHRSSADRSSKIAAPRRGVGPSRLSTSRSAMIRSKILRLPALGREPLATRNLRATR